jgi:hypothetical protein
MDHLPLTRPAPFTEIPFPADMETLWPELAPPGLRPFSVTATRPSGDSEQCLLNLIVREDDILRAVAMAVELCAGLDDFEIRVGRVAGG